MTSPMRRLQATVCLLLAMLGIACVDATALPAGSERFDPPPEYQLWWRMTEACSGLRGSLADIEWSVVPGTEVLPGTNGEFSGEWFEQGNRIVLAGAVQLDGPVVRHEMLHALVRATNHVRIEFLERCAGTVVCAGECIRDSEPPLVPPAGTPLVSPGALEIGVEIRPTTPRGSQDGGYFTVVVSAHNPAGHAVVTQLPITGYAGLPFTFVFRATDGVRGVSAGDRAYDPEVTYFEPNETKRESFDVHMDADGSGDGLTAGTYRVDAAFGEHASPVAHFTLAP